MSKSKAKTAAELDSETSPAPEAGGKLVRTAEVKTDVKPWSAAEMEFMVGMLTLGEQFAGFWDPEKGDRLLGYMVGKREIRGYSAYKIKTAFPVEVLISTPEEGLVRLTAESGQVVVVWSHYQIEVLDQVPTGAKVCIVRGEQRDIGNGRTCIDYQVSASAVKPPEGAASAAHPS